MFHYHRILKRKLHSNRAYNTRIAVLCYKDSKYWVLTNYIYIKIIIYVYIFIKIMICCKDFIVNWPPYDRCRYISIALTFPVLHYHFFTCPDRFLLNNRNSCLRRNRPECERKYVRYLLWCRRLCQNIVNSQSNGSNSDGIISGNSNF